MNTMLAESPLPKNLLPLFVQSIRRKIFAVVILLVSAIGLSFIIYQQGGFSLVEQKPQPSCGVTSSIAPLDSTSALGQPLFSANCASCHAINKELIGPALADVEQRLPFDTIYLLLQNPKLAVKRSRYLKALTKQYDMEHYTFNSLTKAELRNVLNYIKRSSQPVY